MNEIKDRFILGALSGFISIIPIKYLNNLEYKLGLTDETYVQSGASLLLPHGLAQSNKKEVKIAGYLAHNTMTAISGSLIAYLYQ